jgi:predicted aspartyl protease
LLQGWIIPLVAFRFISTISLLFLSVVSFAEVPDDACEELILTGLPVDEPVPQGSFQSLIIPLRKANSLFLMEAKVDDQSGYFILDTGAPYLVLNETYFRKYRPAGELMAANVNGTASQVFRTTVKRLAIQELFYESLQTDVTDLSQIENQRGVKILGLLGFNLFMNFEMILDTRENRLHLNKLDKQGNVISPLKTMNRQPDMKAELMVSEHSVTVQGNIGAQKLVFCLDTGAEMNVMHIGISKKIQENIRIIKPLTVNGTGGSRSRALLGALPTVKIGNAPFPGMRTLMADLSDLSEAYGQRIDGMLGYDFFGRGIVTMNFKRKELCLYYYRAEDSKKDE